MKIYGPSGELLSSAKSSPVVRHDLPELTRLIQEATQTVEDELEVEDAGWIRGGTTGVNTIITELSRTDYVKLSRLYYLKDPLAKQSIRLWTDYTFGTGMNWSCEDETAKKVLSGYWYSKDNQTVLSARGQRRCSTRLLVDGELFIAIFLGNQVTVRLIDPLEITEIVTDPDDRDNERYFKREWFDTKGGAHTDYYPSHRNIKGEPCQDYTSREITPTVNDVVVYHLPWDNLGNRGMPLLLPALDWIKQYRRFLASRVAIMLARARFAWKVKVSGGSAAVASIKAKTHEEEIPAGSEWIENLGVDRQPIKTETDARNAYEDGRMIKLQVAAAVGIPEQYFGDISIGNLATAKTVELPMMKMFQSYQAIWSDAFQDIDEVVLSHRGNKNPTEVYVDRDFPAIAPEDVFAAAQAIATIITAMPEFAALRDVQQVALLSLGINNVSDVLDKLEKGEGTTAESLDWRVARSLRMIEKEVRSRGNGHKEKV